MRSVGWWGLGLVLRRFDFRLMIGVMGCRSVVKGRAFAVHLGMGMNCFWMESGPGP